LSPDTVWKHLLNYFRLLIYPIFDLAEAQYHFEPEHVTKEQNILFQIPALELILEGTRRMRNQALPATFSPSGEDLLIVRSPDYLNRIDLNPHENYILKLTKKLSHVIDIIKASQIGETETIKIFFILKSLSLIEYSQKKQRSSSMEEYSQAGLDKILDRFNTQCSIIHKYILKEIGPVATNVFEKCLEEIKPTLPPFLQKIKVNETGGIEVDSVLKSNLVLTKEKARKDLKHGLNEILAAEVLIVKKTLGSQHEKILIKNLENLGE
jgi:hypothetical protein